jgi:FkbM family methyltransferase
MKQFLLTTRVGRLLLSGRDNLEIVRAALNSVEEVGTIANDQLATTLITRICRPNTVFIDVGAHLGSVTAEALRNQPSITAVAVEAMPDKAANLRRKFPHVKVCECAVGEIEGEVSFFVNTRLSGFSSLGRPETTNDKDVREIKVAVKRLDDVAPFEGVDAVKIDVEGAELGVLRGSPKLLATSRPTIMFESGPEVNDGLGYTKEALWQQLADAGYAVLVPNRLAHNDPGLSKEAFCESHLYPRRTTNYFAVAKERREELRDRARQILKVAVK